MKASWITKEQWVKVAKALVYAFVSTFLAALVASSSSLSWKVVAAAAVAGVNAVLVTLKQLFTQG